MKSLMAIPTVVLVGKTNVGKSSLFNRLSRRRFNIAHSTPGATRDCIIKESDFLGNSINLVDSGGIEHGETKNPFQDLVSARVAQIVESKASLVLFVVSAKDGITAQDHEIANLLRQIGKPTVLVINKVDHESNEVNALEFSRFGFNDFLMVSAAQNQGLWDLRRRVVSELGLLPKGGESESHALTLVDEDKSDDLDSKISISLVGKPNSGKSTLVNAILHEDRVMVSDIPGTTVDAVDTELSYSGKEICLIDTAGIRRQRSIHEEVEKMAVARTLCAIDRSQVAILLINAQEDISEQDQKIAGIIFEKKKACVIAINKWDEEIKSEKSKEKFLDHVRFNLPFLSFAPVVFISAKYGHQIFDAIDLALRLAPRYRMFINTSKVNRTLERAQVQHQPPVFMGKRLKLPFATQVGHSPPTFVISCSQPQGVHFSYKRFLTNFFRDDLEFSEIPIRLIFRKKSDKTPFNRCEMS